VNVAASSPLRPPLAPMLARLVRELPADGYLYEPKWDGFRCLVFREQGEVDLRSRNQRPLARYFPELVEALLRLPAESCVLDGEIVVTTGARFDFEALLRRLHPAASRVERLRVETPASLVAFDVLAHGPKDLRGHPFHERRRLLAELVGEAGPALFLTPLTADVDEARRWLERYQGGGIDGIVAKHREMAYEPGKRAMFKFKH
jgi:ATP-dependent DNA ligase